MTETVLYETRGTVAVVTINRPQARNAIDVATARALDNALTRADVDDDVRVVVLTGAEDKAFSAGMDLKAFANGAMPFTEHGFAGVVEHPFSKPLIGAANGSAFAGGFEVLLSCDLIIAAEHALFGLPEVQRGLFAGAGGLLRLPRRIPRSVAAQMALTGDPITAVRAYELGLVNAVVPSATLLTDALALATRIAANAPLAVRVTKQVLRETMDMNEAEGWRASKEAFERIAASADALEGAVAFAEKRAPDWTGR
jgi:enoyl-CoA hydratase/carnithine racemase